MTTTADNTDATSDGDGPRRRPKLLLTVKEAAAQLGIGQTLLRELEMRGELRALRLGRAVRFEYDELERFVHALRRRQCADSP